LTAAKGIAMSARITTFTAVLVLSSLGLAHAADGALPCGTPALVVQPGGGCTACEVMPMARTKMKSTGCQPNWLDKHHPLPPKPVELCPGACFGYFPTQWRRWEDTCPYPFTMNPDPLHPPIPTIPASDAWPGKNGKVPDPRPLDPKKMKSSIAPLNIPGSRIN
jgi:hypothetical protein